jgi:DNA polymerase-1
VFGLDGYSAREEDDNFLKKVAPEWRNKSKVFTLAVVYGANAFRIGGLLGLDWKEAQKIIDKYLDAYPNLRLYMESQEEDAIVNGKVYTAFGRVRHLADAKNFFKKYRRKIYNKKMMKDNFEDGEEKYYKFRNLMNNAKNFPIQSTAAHVTNAALIELADAFEENDIDGWPALQVHDEIICIIKEDQAIAGAELLKEAMEHNEIANQIDIPMIAVPMIGDNFTEVK